MTPHAAIYLRVSTEGQAAADKYGLELQEDACRAYAKRSGFTVKQVYQDIITGTSSKRAAFSQLLGDLPAYHAVIIFSVDRLARTVPIAYGLAQEIADAGVELHSSTEGKLSFKDDGQATAFGLHALLADSERRRIVRRLSEGKKQKVRGGQPLVPIRAYGYQGGEVYEPEAQWVRWMFQQAASMGTHSIAHDLHRLGITTRAGTPWNRDTIFKILRNSLYRGEYVYGRDRVTRKPLADAISCPAPRIVEDDLWHAVQRALDYRSTGAGRRNSRADMFPLTGRIRCSGCGGALVGIHSRTSSATRRMNHYYQCGDKALTLRNRKDCTHRKCYPVGDIHMAVWEALKDLARDPATLAHAITAPPPARLDTGKAVQDIEGQLSKARNAYLRGIDTEDEYAETKATLTAQRARLLALAEAGETPSVANPARATTALIEALGSENLQQAAVRLGLIVNVAPGGELSLTLDPV